MFHTINLTGKNSLHIHNQGKPFPKLFKISGKVASFAKPFDLGYAQKAVVDIGACTLNFLVMIRPGKFSHDTNTRHENDTKI